MKALVGCLIFAGVLSFVSTEHVSAASYKPSVVFLDPSSQQPVTRLQITCESPEAAAILQKTIRADQYADVTRDHESDDVQFQDVFETGDCTFHARAQLLEIIDTDTESVVSLVDATDSSREYFIPKRLLRDPDGYLRTDLQSAEMSREHRNFQDNDDDARFRRPRFQQDVQYQPQGYR